MKLFVFDMDGTILNNHDAVLEETIEQLKEARKAGHKLAIATGRPFSDIVRALDPSNFDYLIANNGAYFFDVAKNEFIYHTSVDREILKDVMRIGAENNCFLAIHGEQEAVRSILAKETTDWEDPEFAEFVKFKDKFISNKDAIKFSKSQKIMQISLRQTSEIIKKIEGYFTKYNDIADVHIAGDVYLDINPKGVNKMVGINNVKEYASIDADVYVFGDSGNDLQMLKGADYSFCMGNGNPFAKEAATEVIGPNTEPSIAIALRKHIQ